VRTPTHKQLASRHAMRLRTMRKQLLDMAAQWEDVDQFNVAQLTDLVGYTDSVATCLAADTDCEVIL